MEKGIGLFKIHASLRLYLNTMTVYYKILIQSNQFNSFSKKNYNVFDFFRKRR